MGFFLSISKPTNNTLYDAIIASYKADVLKPIATLEIVEYENPLRQVAESSEETES